MSQKSKIIAIVFVVVALIVIGGIYFTRGEKTAEKQVANKDLRSYNDPELNISFSYPSEWGDISRNMLGYYHVALSVNKAIFFWRKQ